MQAFFRRSFLRGEGSAARIFSGEEMFWEEFPKIPIHNSFCFSLSGCPYLYMERMLRGHCPRNIFDRETISRGREGRGYHQ
jgi:hypothetical protein